MHGNTSRIALQHTATHCNTSATHSPKHTSKPELILALLVLIFTKIHVESHCNTLQHICDSLSDAHVTTWADTSSIGVDILGNTCRIALQHTATHCNTSATHDAHTKTWVDIGVDVHGDTSRIAQKLWRTALFVYERVRTLPCISTHKGCNTQQHLQLTATHRDTLQHTASQTFPAYPHRSRCVYVDKHTRTYIYVHIYTYTYIHIWTYIHVCRCPTCSQKRRCVYIDIHIYIYIFIYVCIHKYMYVYIYIYMYLYMCVCVYTHVYIYIYMYVSESPELRWRGATSCKLYICKRYLKNLCM